MGWTAWTPTTGRSSCSACCTRFEPGLTTSTASLASDSPASPPYSSFPPPADNRTRCGPPARWTLGCAQRVVCPYRALIRDFMVAGVELQFDPGELLDALPTAVVVVDAAGRVVACNEESLRLTGYTRAQLVGRPVEVLVPQSARRLHASRRVEFNACRIRRPMGVAQGVSCRRKDGSVFPADISLSPLGASHTVCTIRDDTERQAIEADLRRRALHDPLTSLPNRVLVEDRLALALRRARRKKKCVAVLFVDLDHFKQVNDQLGHAAGDHLLRRVALALEASMRPSDTIGRFGGDEFVAICEDIDDPRDTAAIADRLLGSVRSAVGTTGPEGSVTASIGIALADASRRPDDVIRAADHACYVAKGLGGDCWNASSSDCANAPAQLVLRT